MLENLNNPRAVIPLPRSNPHVFEVGFALYFAAEKPLSLSYVPASPSSRSARGNELLQNKQIDTTILNCGFLVMWTWKEGFRNWSGQLNQRVLLNAFGEKSGAVIQEADLR